MDIASYGEVWNFDDVAVQRQFQEPHGAYVEIEEKVDGFQFSARFDPDSQRLVFRSKNVAVPPGDAGMFQKAVFVLTESLERIGRGDQPTDVHDLERVIRNGSTFRFEFVRHQKHNHLQYNRTPRGHLVLLDIEEPDYWHVNHAHLRAVASQIGVEAPNLLYYGPLPDRNRLNGMLESQSFLGGTKVEGIVIKARDYRNSQDGKMLKAKLVRPDYQESQREEWKAQNPGPKDVVRRLADALSTEARWQKAVQHMREDGELEGSVRDIGPLIARLKTDIDEEERKWIQEALYRHFGASILRQATADFPEWYKRQLAEDNIEPSGTNKE